METLVRESIPQGDEDLSAQERKFPIQLPEELSAEEVKTRSKEYRKIWKQWADKQISQIEIYFKMFLSQAVGPQKSKAQVVLSIASGIIETLTARLCKGTIGRDKWVELMSLDPNKPKEVTQLVEDFLNQELVYVSRGTKKGKSLIKGALIEGIGAWQEVWERKSEIRSNPVYQTAPDGSQMFMGEGAATTVEYQCWNWKEKDPMSIAFDPQTVDTMADSPWTGVRTYKSLAEFKQWEQAGVITGVDEIATITPSGVTNSDDWDTKRKNAMGGISGFDYANHKEYKVDEWRGNITWEIDQEGLDEVGKRLPKKVMSGDYHWILVEETVLILFEPCELQPARKSVGSFPIIIDPRKPVGKSALHDVVGIQQMINTFSGKQADLVTLAADRPTYYDKRSGLSGRTAYQRTQGLIPVNDVNGIKEGTVDTNAISVNQAWLQFLIQFAQNLTAATEQAQGMQGAATATEFAGLMQLIGTRFEELADNIMQFFCVPLGQGCLDYYQQLGQDGQMVVRKSSIDGNSAPITRQMLMGRWQVIPAGLNSQANKDAKTKNALDLLRELMNIAQAAMANPALTQGQLPNIKEAADRVFTMMDLRDTSSLWTPIPEMPSMEAVSAAGGPPSQPEPQAPPPTGVSPEAMEAQAP